MNLSGFMVDTVTVKAASGTTGTKGDPAYGSATTVACRVQQGRDRKVADIAHEAVVYSLEEIAETSRVWLPGTDTNDATAARRAVKTYKTHDQRAGVYLYKTLLGR
jgi:LDH2 family malate/lactate/ureidoglycolate dehydrogenase